MRLVLDEGKTVGQVARDLDLTETAPREWVNRARADRKKGRTGLRPVPAVLTQPGNADQTLGEVETLAAAGAPGGAVGTRSFRAPQHHGP